LAVEIALVANLKRFASEAACRLVAAEQVRLAQEDVLRIQKIETDVETAERVVAELAGKITEAEQALNVARGLQAEADAALAGAEEAARVEGSDSGATDTVVRQQLELRQAAAERAVGGAQQRIDAALAAQKLVEAVSNADRELRGQQARANSALETASKGAGHGAAAV
jgi:hypothetical protein